MAQANQQRKRGYPPPPADYKERMRAYLRNRPQFPPEEWLKHIGEWVAFSWDGKVILAAATEFMDVEKQLYEIGVDPSEVSFAYVPEDNDICLGAAEFEIEYGPPDESSNK